MTVPRPCQCGSCHLCWLYQHDARYNQLWGGNGQVQTSALLPCLHLGQETGQLVPCGSCRGTVQVKTMACSVHGQCTTRKQLDGIACCRTCPDHEADRYRLVAPLGVGRVPQWWQGVAPRKPWHYAVTLVIPHLDTLDLLKAALDLWRLSTERPYLIVVDTGSPPAAVAELERLRDHDLEVHFIKSHGYIHSSGPVAAAMDLGFALCRTQWLFATHADVFLRRREFVAWMKAQARASCPVVGWQMSPRAGTEEWCTAVSHTATMFWMPAMRKGGVTWSFERYYEARGLPQAPTMGFPDTEQPLNHALAMAGIVPRLLGPEPNFARHTTEWFDHARSVPGLRISQSPGSELLRRVEAYGQAALADARQRLKEWQQ